MSESTKRQRDKGHLVKVLEQFTKHPGEVLYRKDIAAASGLTEQQVMSCISSARSRHPLLKQVEVMATGQAWVWRPNSTPPKPEKPTKRIFEEIGPAKDGSVVIEDVDTGTLWKAVEL